ncbi:hypothetical protein DM02DRAFT_659551 [Periconia macrospinosa]|uniref:Uncharacterized protein n=1 Tax=Periconia macrospinosa TaxID=97972 RepID=A0A2V1DD42_9PLEO|nr:hypothetical protein DM02DRAFT_659551 [Periconia macrospinosa]
MLSKTDLEGSFLKLVALASEPIEEYLKTTFTNDDVYRTLIPEAIRLSQESVIPSMIRLWLDTDEATIHAAIRKHLKLAKTFVDNVIALSKVLMEEFLDPLLHLLISTQEPDLSRYLVQNEVNLEVRNRNGETPLLALTGLQTTPFSLKEQKYLDLAQAMVLRGSRGSSSRTPLLLAVESGSVGAVCLLLGQLFKAEEGNGSAGCARVVGAMEYVNMRCAPLLRAIVEKSERKVAIATALVEADEKAFQRLSQIRHTDLSSLRTDFYIEALTWSIYCNFSDGFTFILPKIPMAALSSRRNLDGDTIYHVAAAAKSNEYLTLVGQKDFGGETLSSLNAKKPISLDIVIECGSAEKASLLLLHGVKPTEDQLLKAKKKGILIVGGPGSRSRFSNLTKPFYSNVAVKRM